MKTQSEMIQFLASSKSPYYSDYAQDINILIRLHKKFIFQAEQDEGLKNIWR